MRLDPDHKPKIRPVEAFRIPSDNGLSIGVRERSGLSDMVLSLSEPVLHILAMMDGNRSCRQIREVFEETFGQPLEQDTLQTLLNRLDEAHFLEGPTFERHYRKLLEDYRATGTRRMEDADALGIGNDAAAFFDEILSEAEPVSLPDPIRGLVAPHLDYARGRCCYATAYAALKMREAPGRVIVLGTNHFGRASSVVATVNDFETPLGATRTDRAFLQTLEDRCGSLCEYELDHLREHSVALQVAWLQHLFGPSTFQLVSFLCPDPCGPSGTKPHNGRGVDLRDFARSLREEIEHDGSDTLIVAGADLSHVGAAFGDERALDENRLEEVRRHDREALDRLEKDHAEGFRSFVAGTHNHTNICSVGCVYVLADALPQTTATLLRYHQAVDQATQTCVTCAALAFT